MTADEYEAIPEAEWKVLATTEITHLTDEEKDYLPHAWDEWIARVKRDAAREALDGYAKREEERFHHLHVNGESAEASKCAYAAMTVRAYLHLRYPEEVQ